MLHKIRYLLKTLLFSVLVTFSSYDKKGNVYEFDFEQKWTWLEIKSNTITSFCYKQKAKKIY